MSRVRRADRLFQLVQLLRARPVNTAERLATELEVSARTVYRDVADLIASGVPIEGEAGVGYALPRGFDLPPMMFDAEEIGALVLGARMVQAFGDEALARRAKSVLAKLEAVAPERLRKNFAKPEWHVWRGLSKAVRASVEHWRRGIDEKKKLRLVYTDQKGEHTERLVRPLCLAFWGPVWTAGAWCELRKDFRNFRADRMRTVELTDERFQDEPGKDLPAFLRALQDEEDEHRRGH